MHKKYVKGKDGFTAVSVSFDNPTEQEKVLKFLKRMEAAFPNFILDEAGDVWTKKLDIDGPPCVFVFNREGKIAKKFKDDVDYKEVAKLVADLVKEK